MSGRPPKHRGLVAVAAGVAAGAVALLMSFGASPASADDTSTAHEVTGTSVATLDNATNLSGDKGGDCTDKVCKRIPWCPSGSPSSSPNKPEVDLPDDAPLVMIDGEGGDNEPHCVKVPKISSKCCVADESGKANVHVAVSNPNKHGGLFIRIWIDGHKAIAKWVPAGQTVKFVFTDVANGSYKVHGAVKVGGKDSSVWCVFKFGHDTIRVNCASPSPSHSSSSPSPSVSASASASASTSPTPGGEQSPQPSLSPVGNDQPQLPVTGSHTGIIALGGVALAAAGALLFFGFRRRKLTEQA